MKASSSTTYILRVLKDFGNVYVPRQLVDGDASPFKRQLSEASFFTELEISLSYSQNAQVLQNVSSGR